MKRKSIKIANEVREFEKTLSRQTKVRRYVLSLFVTGSTPKSLRAIQNIQALCRDRLEASYDLRVIDIYQHPEQAKPEQIVVTPTLIKKRPLPLRILIGDLSNGDRVLGALGIIPKSAAS
jgi:circadian clock protein KaiB